MQSLLDALTTTPLVYITRDIDRALGMPEGTPGYHIISNLSPAAKAYEKRTHIVLIAEDQQLDTRDLLTHPHAVAYIKDLKKKHGTVNILVFKSTPHIERVCARQGWNLLNPSAALANIIEEKISQVTWLGDVAKLLPEHTVTTCQALSFNEKPFVVQFNRAHTGEGTILIESEKQIDELKQRHPAREVRVTTFIPGPIFTANIVIAQHTIFVGNISYQITGLKPYTDNPFATMGNDWGLPTRLLTLAQQKKIKDITHTVGRHMVTSGWKGLFGIDVVMDERSNDIYLLEINARQPQSATYESRLQSEKLQAESETLTVFHVHLAALLGIDIKRTQLIEINDGAQLIDRRTNTWHRFSHSIMNDHMIPKHEYLPVSDACLPAGRVRKSALVPLSHHEVRDSKGLTSDSWKTLSPEATTVVDNYLNLPIVGKTIQCPYLNNKRKKLRGALRVMIGKGTPEEIIEEAKLIALKKKIDLEALDEDSLKRFLIEQGLGIECSGFVYHVLDAELRARGKGSLKQHLRFPHIKSPLRKLLAKIRSTENTNVKTLNYIANSNEIGLKDVQPGDIMTQMDIDGRDNHVFLVQGIKYEDGKPSVIFYVHANQMPADGKYDHGVRQGSITITDLSKPIEKQKWPTDDNTIAIWGEHVSVRRLNCLL